MFAVLLVLVVCLLIFKGKKVTDASSEDLVVVDTAEAELFDSPNEQSSEEESSYIGESEEESSVVETNDSTVGEEANINKVAKKNENTNKVELPVIEENEIPLDNSLDKNTSKQEATVNKTSASYSEDSEEEKQSTGSNNSTSNSTPAQIQVPEADMYYQEKGTVISLESATDSNTVPTEKQVIEILEARGFGDYPITYEYDMGGAYEGEKTITGDEDAKRPMYQTIYLSKNDEIWTIFVINGVIFANPVSFNLESTLQTQLLVSESDKLVSYSHKTNNYYVTIPKETAAIVMAVDKIDADSLDKLTVEEIKKYEKK